MDKKKVYIWLGVAIVILVMIAIYFTFFFTKPCNNIECFNSAILKCQKVSFIDDRSDAAWQYRIIGEKESQCEVYVKLLQLKLGTANMQSLENKEMICMTPLNAISVPQSNLDKCHGELKEEMQKSMINKLFAYISSNIGTISEELQKII